MDLIASLSGLVLLLGSLASSEKITPPEIPAPNAVNAFQLKLHRFLEGSRIRKARKIQGSDGPPATHQMRVGSSSPENLPYLSDYSLTFWIPAAHRQVLAGTREGHLVLFELSQADDRVARMAALSLDEGYSVKARAFSYYHEEWFVILQSSAEKTWLRTYLRVGRGLERRQTILLEGESDFNLVNVKGVYYLSVVTFRNHSTQAGLFLYHWTKTQFDVIASRTLPGARSVATWVMDGSLYFAVAQEWGSMRAGSPVFLFNAKDGNQLILLDMLATQGPTKVVHFFVRNSHYVIFVGKGDAAIYWWSNNQFLFWQSIKGTAFASDVSVLALENGEVVIVIVLKEEALFLTLDSSGHYIVSFTMLLTGINLRSLQFIYTGKAYYALALSADSTPHQAQHVWKLTLDPYTMPSSSTLTPLHQCLGDLAENLNKHQSEMNTVYNAMDRVWFKSKNQTITADVFVSSEMSSPGPSSITEILIFTTRKILPDASLPMVGAAIDKLRGIADAIQRSVGNIVLKSTAQEIKGAKHFQESIFIPSLNMESTNVDVPINGVPVSRIYNYALKKVGDQTFHYPLGIGNTYAEQVEILFLNGIQMEDFLQLGGRQEITGDLKFLNVFAMDMALGTINTIPVDNFVITNSEQILRDLKHFSALQANIVGVQGQTNGEDLKDFYNMIVTRNEEYDLRERYAMESTLHIYGDLFVTGMVNGKFDIPELKFNTVTKHEDQDLKGRFTFTSPLHIRTDLSISGHVNEISTHDLLTLSTDQVIPGHLIFHELVTFDRDLLVDLVNDVDLDKTALTRTTHDHQFLMGRKTFVHRMVADFVEMTDFVTLDAVDPSLLVQDIVKHREGVVQSDGTVFHDVVVLGNVTAVEGVNGHKIFDLPEIVWLKSVPQTIHVPVAIVEVSVKELEVVEVNDYTVEKDLVFTFDDETILSFKTFIHNVSVVENVNAIGGKINGFEIVTFTEELDNYEKEGTIRGQKRMQTLEIYGDIEVQNVNNLPVHNIMRPHVYQEVKDQVEFPSELTYIRNDLNTKDVKFNVYNGKNLKGLVDTFATKTPKEAVKNKAFEKVIAQDLVVYDNSLINGIPISEMLRRVVTLNTPQQILSEKTFLQPIHLQKASTDYLNGKKVPEFISNVVLTDSVTNTPSHKAFNGSFHADNIFIYGLINDLNFDTLHQNIFYKSSENKVKSPVHFRNEIAAGNLVTGSVMDGLRREDLIFTNQNEVLDYLQLLSYANLKANFVVGGLLNGCDLVQLGQRALYSKKSNQHINEVVTVQTIQVLGNLNLRNVVNELPIEELYKNFITITKDQIVEADVRLSNGFKVENLQVASTTNGISIPFILGDAVRHSIPQEVKGFKRFYDLKSSVMASRDTFIAEKLNDVNVNDIYSNAVLKHGHQIITGEKIFRALRTDVASIQGYINSLKLPDDVVRTDTTDLIPHPVVFTTNMVLADGVSVDGRVDGVLIPALVHSRVTLKGEDVLRSRLSFLRDVASYGDLYVGGTVNNLVLEMVCKVKQPFPVDGYKAFIQDVHVLSALYAPLVNGYDIQQMDSNILHRNKEEFVNELQVFKKQLRAKSSLNTKWINGVSLSDITSSYFSIVGNTHRTLNYFDDLITGFNEKVTHQIEATRNRISRFAYFILVQEINMGPTTKILHGYRLEPSASEFSHWMVVWASRRHCTYAERCCTVELTHWARVKRATGQLIVESEAVEGRLYPVHNLAPVILDKDFVAWTNASEVQPKWCGYRYDETLSFLLSGATHHQAFMSIRNTPLLSEVKTFSQGHLYAVAGFFYNRYESEYSSSVVYVYNEIKREWSQHQILPSFGVLSLDITHHTDGNIKELLLAMGTGTGTYSSVYSWNNIEHEFELVRNIPSAYVTNILWGKQGSTQLLAMASVDHWPKKEDCREFLSGGQVDIYTYKSREIRWIQSIPLRGVVSMITFEIEGDTFLVAASHQLQSIYIYEWRGYAGFSQVQSMFVGEVRHLSTYSIGDEHYLAVAVASGPSKILKVMVQGHHAISHLPGDPALQKDEASIEDQLMPAC